MRQSILIILYKIRDARAIPVYENSLLSENQLEKAIALMAISEHDLQRAVPLMIDFLADSRDLKAVTEVHKTLSGYFGNQWYDYVKYKLSGTREEMDSFRIRARKWWQVNKRWFVKED